MSETVTYPHLEKHVSGDDDSPTVGWRWLIDAHHSVWCGEISRALFDRQEADHRETLGNDYGWFLVLFGKDKSVILGRALDEYQGCDVAHSIALGLVNHPKLIATLLEAAP